MEYIQSGGLFAEPIRRLVEQAGAGDVFYFDEITCRCLGGAEPRKVNALVVKLE